MFVLCSVVLCVGVCVQRKGGKRREEEISNRDENDIMVCMRVQSMRLNFLPTNGHSTQPSLSKSALPTFCFLTFQFSHPVVVFPCVIPLSYPLVPLTLLSPVPHHSSFSSSQPTASHIHQPLLIPSHNKHVAVAHDIRPS